MGKGTIIDSLGKGLYRVKLEVYRSAYNRRVSALEKSLAQVQTEISKAAPKDKPGLELQALAIRKRLAQLERATPSDRLIEAYCTEYNEDLTGAVATIEIPGEPKAFNILPRAWENSDGQLVPTATLTPEQAFYFLAMLPGWQKWRPMYRYATIVSISQDHKTAGISLESAVSSQQSLDVNPHQEYSDVPLEYMEDMEFLYEVGDRVVVSFPGPKVIGFKEKPKMGIYYVPLADLVENPEHKPATERDIENNTITFEIPPGTTTYPTWVWSTGWSEDKIFDFDNWGDVPVYAFFKADLHSTNHGINLFKPKYTIRFDGQTAAGEHCFDALEILMVNTASFSGGLQWQISPGGMSKFVSAWFIQASNRADVGIYAKYLKAGLSFGKPMDETEYPMVVMEPGLHNKDLRRYQYHID